MNQIKLHNTLTNKKEVFEPLEPGKVSIYNCGPTVYDRAHIGNLRSYVFADILRRTFEYNDFKVHQVINITDVGHLSSNADEGEDKMTKALKREGRKLTLEDMRKVGEKYFEIFKNDLQSLNIEMPEEFPRASDNINEDIELIEQLENKGFAYKTSDGMYFDTSKFDSYGKLGNIDISKLKQGARVAVSTEKKSPVDFALWKFDENLGWQSPWGKGFPGWHIECSAMSRKYLGQPFDIHTGGIDHIPVHHNNEIAQSEAAYNTPLANYWMHNEFLIVNEGRMGKSEGNAITLETLKESGISPIAYKYWLLTAHYRTPVNFSLEAVSASGNAFDRLITMVGEMPKDGEVSTSYKEKFTSAINDDLDTPRALSIIWELLKDGDISLADKKATILDFDRALGLNIVFLAKSSTDVPPEITALAEEREQARLAQDWVKADEMRNRIEAMGYEVKDTPSGAKILKSD